MKKFIFIFTLLSIASFASAQTLRDITMQNIPVSIKAGVLTTDKDYQGAVSLLANSYDSEVIYTAGAALAASPAPVYYTNDLLSIAISANNDLKKIFAAVALAAMDENNVETIPLLESALESGDVTIRGYAAAALALTNAQTPGLNEYIFALYPYDYIFARRALRKLYAEDKKLFVAAKKAASSKTADARRGAAQVIGNLNNSGSAKVLLSMLKKEKEDNVQPAIAMALSKKAKEAVGTLEKCLSQAPQSSYAKGCALALGFMPDYSVSVIKNGLIDTNEKVRVNSARAAAAATMALSGVDASYYSTDVPYARQEIKTLIPQLLPVASGSGAGAPHAQKALDEIKKLL
ncbi:HEAT repeat protein [Elusimicrobium posterum]|uniref:hypothetical protein n=1 Tax=Elusimicrobium posterum TaxID=3116653 RepID=UPI003C757595